MIRKDLTKEQVLLAMRHTKSNRSAARYLNVSYIHYKMWAKQYNEFEGGRTLFEVHKNQSGKGIPKFLSGKYYNHQKFGVLDIIEGRVSPTHYTPETIKKMMILEGYLKEECALCSFNERRVSDYKIPLLLNFKDNNPLHYNLGNIRFLCYNCYFLTQGDVFNKNDIRQLETHTTTYNTSETIDFELDDYQKEQMEKLGLYQPPKPDDGSELISRT